MANLQTQKIAQHQFAIFYYSTQNAILEIVWLDATEHMEERDYKEVMLFMVEQIRQYRPQFLLGNTTHFRYPIHPNLQIWTAENIISQFIAHKIPKMALLIPEELIASLSVQQSVEEAAQQHEAPIETKYFDQYERAVAWLLR